MQFDQISNLAALITGILALALSIYGIFSLRGFNQLRKTFFAGRTGLDLETVIRALHNDLQNLKKEQMVLENVLDSLKQDFTFAVQKIGIVRFNPFGDDGGNFSFCLALLDGHNNGMVLTSMHGRQQNRIYTKKIISGNCETELTQEEQEAITNANIKTQIQKK